MIAAPSAQVIALLADGSTTMPHAKLIAAKATTERPVPVGASAKMQLVPPGSAASALTVIGMELMPKILAKKVGAFWVMVACTK